MMERDLYLYGPDPETGEHRITHGSASWEWSGDELQLWVSGVCGEFGAASEHLFGALWRIRQDLAEQGWLVLVAAARRDAWHSTDESPCAPEEVRIYPTPGEPPAAEPVGALEPVVEPGMVSLVATPEQQWLYHRRGAPASS